MEKRVDVWERVLMIEESSSAPFGITTQAGLSQAADDHDAKRFQPSG